MSRSKDDIKVGIQCHQVSATGRISRATYDATVRPETATWSQKYAVTWLPTYTLQRAPQLIKKFPALCVKGTGVHVHTAKASRGRRGIAPLCLNLSFTPAKKPRTNCRGGCVGREKSLPLAEFDPRTVQPVAQWLHRQSYPCFCIYVTLNIHNSLFPKRRVLYLKQRRHMLPPPN
jgi:hypothetical protein